MVWDDVLCSLKPPNTGHIERLAFKWDARQHTVKGTAKVDSTSGGSVWLAVCLSKGAHKAEITNVLGLKMHNEGSRWTPDSVSGNKNDLVI